MTDGNLWKWLASLLGSILVTGLIAWVSFGGGVSKAEGQTLKDKDAEHDSKLAVIEEKLATQQAVLNEVRNDVKDGNKATQDKLDAIILSLPRGSSNDRNR